MRKIGKKMTKFVKICIQSVHLCTKCVPAFNPILFYHPQKLRKHKIREHPSLHGSRDPELAARLENIVGPYLNPPQHALLLSVDEKSQTQMLLPLAIQPALAHAGHPGTPPFSAVI
jgi:hypothetical protein